MADTAAGFRNEIKYLINYKSYLLLRARIKNALQHDPHSKEYNIRSLYFDDVNESAFNDRLDGINEREKYRIRIYDFSSSIIKLEKKARTGQFVYKEAASISKELLKGILNQTCSQEDFMESKLLTEFYTKLRKDVLRPSVIVEYYREAYVSSIQNTRITFDKALKCSMNSYDLFDRGYSSRSLLPQDTMILEVKFDRFLPEYIREFLQISSSNRMSISKYVLCRANNFNRGDLEWMEL